MKNTRRATTTTETMCDTTTLISSQQTDLHSCWIIYTKSDGRERLTVTDAKPMMPHAINSNTSSSSHSHNNNDNDASEDSDNDGPDQSLHEILDPELQPEPPIPDNAQSQEIYEEHRRLAKEYLRVDTKLYYAQDLKEKLLAQMDPVERQQKQELLKKMSEKEELLELYNNLKQQLQKIRSAQQPPAATTSSAQQPPQKQTDTGSGWQAPEGSAGVGGGGAGAGAAAVGEDWVVVAAPPAESKT